MLTRTDRTKVPACGIEVCGRTQVSEVDGVAMRRRYVMATDSAAQLATRIRGLARSGRVRRIIDIGAGDAVLATRLLGLGVPVVAVDPELDPEDHLADLCDSAPLLTRVPKLLEDSGLTPGTFDLGVVSYVLETLSEAEQDSLLTRALSLLTDQGRLLGVSFAEGSPWDQYVDTCRQVCGGKRYIGTWALANTLSQRGWILEVVDAFSSHITAPTLDELFDVCAHFMGPRASAYHSRRHLLLPALDRSVTRTTDSVLLEVAECLYIVGPSNHSSAGD